MGVVFINSLDSCGIIGLWEITAPYKEMESKYQLQKGDMASMEGISNEVRKLQILCTRLLIREMDPGIDTSLLTRDAMGMPYFKEAGPKISISHSGKYVTVSLSFQHKTGIDIEKIGEKVNRVQDKFMNGTEKKCGIDQNIDCIHEYQHVIWGAKEALFKLYGKGGVSFKEDLAVMPFQYQDKGSFNGKIYKADFEQSFSINYERIGDYMLVYVYG